MADFASQKTPEEGVRMKTKFGNDIRVFKTDTSSAYALEALKSFVAKSYSLKEPFLLQAYDEDNVKHSSSLLFSPLPLPQDNVQFSFLLFFRTFCAFSPPKKTNKHRIW